MRKTLRFGNRFPRVAFLHHDGPPYRGTVLSALSAARSEAFNVRGRGHPLSLLARLAPHLPYVRRYARALTGDQTTGDHYVRVALEALAAGERVLESSLTPRVALYHVFHAIWCSSGAQLEAPAGDDGGFTDDTTRRLMRIAPRSRQAFLLTALE